MPEKQHGFTLIELMIVVALMGILATIALPAYKTYAKRSQFTEAILATSSIKRALELCIQNGNPLNQCADGGATTEGLVVASSLAGATNANHVATATMTALGAIIITGAATVDGKKIYPDSYRNS